MNTLNPIMRGYIYAALESVFGPEWLGLTSAQQERIAQDAADAGKEDGCTARQYHQRIGTGNLAAYVEVLSVSAKHTAPRKAAMIERHGTG